MASKPSPEFRAEAVRVALTSGLSRKQVAADFGVGFSTLSRWIQRDRRNPEKPTFQSDLEREVAELRKENLGRHENVTGPVLPVQLIGTGVRS